MNAQDHGRRFGRPLTALALTALLAATAQGQLRGPRTQPTPDAPSNTAARTDPAKVPTFAVKEIPVNPTDPIATVNQEVITRQQLADECVAREGTKVLEAMIARRLIEQSIRSQKLEITAAEIDAEIDSVAMRIGGVGREAWLRTLDKEKGISPAQYARDIIYPSIALRKLAAPRVQVTEADMKDAFEANFGERLHCRIIMVKDQRTSLEICEELRKNPGSFEFIAKNRSTDTSTRALGGMLPEPIARHAFPRNISDSAYQQLVDGDINDKNLAHKPKDGDITGPIQVNEGAWLILRREQLDPPKSQNANDPQVKQMLQTQMFDVKLKEAMGHVFEDVLKTSRIENHLTGMIKAANEDKLPEGQVDGQVRATSNEAPGRASTAPGTTGGKPASPGVGKVVPRGTAPLPVGLPADAAQNSEAVRKTFATPRAK